MDGIALVSGGKDSVFALIKAINAGINIKKIITVIPPKDDMMFHHPNVDLVELQAKALKIQWIEVEYDGAQNYTEFLREKIEKHTEKYLVVGAIKSNYQRKIINESCKSIDIEIYMPSWGKDEYVLMKEYLSYGLKIIITSVSAYGLDRRWLGKSLDWEALEDLKSLSEKYGVNITGEGGEYETLVVDAPDFLEKIKIIEAEKYWFQDHGLYIIKNAKLEKK